MQIVKFKFQVQVCLLTPLSKQKNKTDKTENE